MNKWCEKEIEELLQLISESHGPDDVRKIFDVVLTPREINDMARRLKILSMIEDGSNYSDISTKLGVSSATISKVSGKIGFGFRRGNRAVLTKQVKFKSPIKIVPGKVRYKGAPAISIKLNND